jgi:hypothetical protein
VIQVGIDKATVAAMTTTPIAADNSTNPASILCNLHAKNMIRMLVMRGKNMAGFWLKFVRALKHSCALHLHFSRESADFLLKVVRMARHNLGVNQNPVAPQRKATYC